MKKSVKALLLVMCAIVLVVATVFTTLAYMTSKTETIKNTFTFGNISITLDEAAVDKYGNLLNTEGTIYNQEADDTLAERVTEGTQEYKLVPGNDYTKDPTIHVGTGSEDAWVFVQVKNNLPENITDGLVVDTTAGKWTKLSENGETAVYYREYTVGDPVVDYPVFTATTFKVNNVNDAALATVSGKSVDITGFAIQKDDTINSAQDAWNAVAAQYNG